jgi:hypothetical protein
MTEVSRNNEPLAQSLEQYRKIWAESLEQYQKFMATGQSYLKPWTDFLEQYQKMTESFFHSSTERSPKE